MSEKLGLRVVPISKMDEGQRIVKGLVYQPNVLDTQGDWMTPEAIQKCAYQFMKDLNLHEVDTDHDLVNVDAYVCESYIAKSDDPEGYPEGAWVVAMKIDSDDVWEGVLNKDYTGFSMWGTGIAYDNTEPPTE